jgi:hypothetical protein
VRASLLRRFVLLFLLLHVLDKVMAKTRRGRRTITSTR